VLSRDLDATQGGTMQPHQQLFLRPVPGLGGPQTPVTGPYLAGSSAHPGGGVHGACGSNAARAALRQTLAPLSTAHEFTSVLTQGSDTDFLHPTIVAPAVLQW
jgi:hypothetical protein